MSETSDTIQIKGIRDGLLVTLGTGVWTDLQTALIKNIDGQTAFFQGARLALDVGSQVLYVAELAALRDKLSERGISLWAILSDSPVTEQTTQNLGLATRISKPRPSKIQNAQDIIPENAVLWVHQTLRSGQRVAYEGHVVVIGDVNPGAEIVAGGNIVVWGRLRGVVHAGAQGNDQAIVCALDFSPAQLRIAGEIATSPERKGKPQPEIAHLKNGHLMAEPWHTDK